jgi:hypothetical protein
VGNRKQPTPWDGSPKPEPPPAPPLKGKHMTDLQLLGLKVKDKVTGCVGIVESISYDLYGCVQAVVKPPVDEKGAIVDGRWFDVSRLEVLDLTPVMAIPGNRFSVERRADPTPSRSFSGPCEKPAR